MQVDTTWGVLQRDVDEEVDGRVEDDQSVGYIVDDGKPLWPRVGTLGVQAFVGRGDEFPSVAEDEEPDDA